MNTFDFDRLDPIALEQTLAYLRAHPEPEDFQALMDDAFAEKDWMADGGMADIGMEEDSESNEGSESDDEIGDVVMAYSPKAEQFDL
jgi:hypothetical protein